jgi:hypothetical protein
MVKILEVRIKKSAEQLENETINNSFINETDEYLQYFEGITHEINNTEDFFNSIKDILKLENNMFININNIYYDKNIIVQSIVNSDLPDVEVLIKRKIEYNNPTNIINIPKNFSYSFGEFIYADKIDPYIYVDITYDEYIILLKKMSIRKGVKINGTIMEQIEYIIIDDTDIYGKMLIKHNAKSTVIEFLNIKNVILKYNQDNENNNSTTSLESQIDIYITERNNDVKFIYSQHNIGIGILNCMYEIKNTEKNSIISKIIGCDIFGTCYVGIDDHNKDTFMPIDLFVNDIEEISKKTYDEYFQKKNPYFCNFYRELYEME